MNILLFSQSFHPNIGGVEKHILGLIPEFQKAGHQISIITINNKSFKNYELIDDVKIYRINHPPFKILGLLKIWLEIFKKIKIIREADIIHIHDVFLYFLPFKIIFPKKKIINVFHGWENIYPVPKKNIIYKQLAQKLSFKSISIGDYVNKYHQLNSYNNFVSYGAVKTPKEKISFKNKEKNTILFLGRLEKDTGLETFFKTLDLIKKELNLTVTFCGDGPLRKRAESYGAVKGFINPEKELIRNEFCFVGGYLSMLEAFSYRCHVIASYENPLKRDYWLDSLFSDYLIVDHDPKKLKEKIISVLKNKKENQKKINEVLALTENLNFKKLAALYLRIGK